MKGRASWQWGQRLDQKKYRSTAGSLGGGASHRLSPPGSSARAALVIDSNRKIQAERKQTHVPR
jgi:hypothetical protein